MIWLFGTLAVISFIWMGTALGDKDYTGGSIMAGWVLLFMAGMLMERRKRVSRTYVDRDLSRWRGAGEGEQDG